MTEGHDMVEFTAKIAGHAIGFQVLCPETRMLFSEYLTEEPPQITITSGEGVLQAERLLMKQTDKENSLSVDGFPDRLLESNFLYREVEEQLAVHGIVLIHGSAVAVDGEGYLFIAPSGTGKSTHTRLWREAFGSRVVMINDDKPLLECTEDGILAYGSPWNGKHRLGENIAVPLKAICFLRRGSENQIEKISDTQAFLPMLKAVYHAKAAEREACILRSLQYIRKKTAFYQLQCNMEPDAAIVSFEAMK